MNLTIVAALWLPGAVFAGLFGDDGNCRFVEEQAVRTMRRIGADWPLRSLDDSVSEYAQRLGIGLARTVDPGLRQPWDFYVLRNAEPSAIAVGGGHFVISDGLIALVRSESELAAVLAHEIAHQSLGHFCREVSPTVERIDRGTVVQHYDLDVEMEADDEALRLLASAGFDAGAMESVLRCLRRLPGTSGPHLSKRIRALGKRRNSHDSRGNARSAAAFEQVRGLVLEDLGESARQECR